MNKLFKYISILLMMLAIGNAIADEKQEKIGSVNLDKIMRAHPSISALEKIEKEVKQLNDSIVAKQNNLESMQKSLEKALPNLNKKDANKKKVDFNKAVEDFAKAQQEAEQKHSALLKDWEKNREKLILNIDSTIKEYAEANGYTLVINESLVLYMNNKDITPEIIKKLKPFTE